MIRVWSIARLVWLEMIRRKDFYVLLILLAALMFFLLSANAFGLGATPRYLLDSGLLMVWVASVVLVVMLTGRQLPSEERDGTIFPLLAKPVGRGQLILGKWLGGWLAGGAATAVFYAVVVAVVWARGGHPGRVTLLQSWLLQVAGLGVMAALTLALSTRMTYGAAATTALLVIGGSSWLLPRVPTLVLYASGWQMNAMLLLYYLLPHFELFDMRRRVVHDWGPIDPVVLAKILVYAGILVCLFLLLAWLAYRHKKFRRSELL